MNAEQLQTYCLQQTGVEETQPFGPDNLVYKVGGKMFLLVSLDAVPLQLNVKCEPDKAEDLRAQYASVRPGYHMNKKHWNTVVVDGSVSDKIILQWVADSYQLVYESLPKKTKESLAATP